MTTDLFILIKTLIWTNFLNTNLKKKNRLKKISFTWYGKSYILQNQKSIFKSTIETKTKTRGELISFQKQPLNGVLKKMCSENMQQIYRRTPMPKCDFNKVAKQTTSTNEILDPCTNTLNMPECGWPRPLKITNYAVSDA